MEIPPKNERFIYRLPHTFTYEYKQQTKGATKMITKLFALKKYREPIEIENDKEQIEDYKENGFQIHICINPPKDINLYLKQRFD